MYRFGKIYCLPQGLEMDSEGNSPVDVEKELHIPHSDIEKIYPSICDSGEANCKFIF